MHGKVGPRALDGLFLQRRAGGEPMGAFSVTPQATRRASIVVALATLLAVVGLAPAAHALTDTTPPQLVSLSFSPSSVNTATGPATVTVTVEVTDDLSGVRDGSVSVNFQAPTGQSETPTLSLVSGTSLDGIYRATVTFPQYGATGIWTVGPLCVFDNAENGQCPDSAMLSADGFPTQLTVTNGNASASPQTISFGPLKPLRLGTPPFAVSATASSGLPVSFSSASPSVCAVSGATVTLTAGGLCTVDASQVGNTAYLPAADVLQSFLVQVYTGGPLGDCHGAALTAPTHASSAPGDGSAVVSWFPTQNPPPSGCTAGYVVTPTLNGVAQPPVLIPGGRSTTVLKGLTNGGVYTFTVASEDGSVVGPASIPTAKITVGTPTAATALKVTRVAQHAVRVAFKSAGESGASITSYTATCQSSNGGSTKSTSGKAGPLTVTGLTSDKSYTCTVTATNSRGIGMRSARSGPIKG